MGKPASSGASAASSGRLSRGVLLALICLLGCGAALAGCGGSSHPKRTTTTSTPTASARTTTSTTTPNRAAARGIVTFTYVQDQDTYQQSYSRVTIYDLRRSGPYVTLDFGQKCLTSSGCSGVFFSTNSGNYGGAPDETPADISLVDPANNLEYLPVTDAKGNEFSSVDQSTSASDPVTLMWVRFPAPPPSVTSLDVLFTGGGPEVPHVPITTAAAGPTPAEVGGGAVAAAPNQFAQPPSSTSTAGLHLEVHRLQLAVGNHVGNDAESPGHSTLTLSADVLFHFNKSNLTPTAQSVLTQVAARIKSSATGTVSVDGYTDSIGTTQYNLGLSLRRAQSVVNFLKPATAGTTVTYSSQGFGEADPVAPNTLPSGADNPAGRALNRRVTISYDVKKPVTPSPPVTATAPSAPSTGSPSRSAKFTIDNGGSTGTYLATVDSLFRDGDMVVLRFSTKCLAETGSAIGCDGILNLGGDTEIPPYPDYKSQGAGAAYRTVAGIYLQDPNGSDYIAVYTAGQKNPLSVSTNQYLGDVPFPMWAYYPAPPASVSAMTVVFPTGVKVADVPISDSPPPLQ
jgi:outer membrane protein OmpA-like peptidoglycan-associated protein